MIGVSPKTPQTSHITMVLRGLRGALNWVSIMPRAASLSASFSSPGFRHPRFQFLFWIVFLPVFCFEVERTLPVLIHTEEEYTSALICQPKSDSIYAIFRLGWNQT